MESEDFPIRSFVDRTAAETGLETAETGREMLETPRLKSICCLWGELQKQI